MLALHVNEFHKYLVDHISIFTHAHARGISSIHRARNNDFLFSTVIFFLSESCFEKWFMDRTLTGQFDQPSINSHLKRLSCSSSIFSIYHFILLFLGILKLLLLALSFQSYQPNHNLWKIMPTPYSIAITRWASIIPHVFQEV